MIQRKRKWDGKIKKMREKGKMGREEKEMELVREELTLGGLFWELGGEGGGWWRRRGDSDLCDDTHREWPIGLA